MSNMAIQVSALKAAGQIERRTEVNRMRRTRVRNQIRAMRRAIESKNVEEANKLLSETFSLVDRAARWGVIKKNTAARYKSRMHLRIKKLAA